MISYELAKRLKDAGFPQAFPKSDFMNLDDASTIQYIKDKYCHHGTLKYLCGADCCMINPPLCEDVYFPTLSELIDACGDKFNILHFDNFKKEWFAYSNDPKDEVDLEWYHDGEYSKGKTPDEAVANLYIELHK